MARSTSGVESYALALLRMVAGFTFSLHGLQKFGALGGLGGHAAATFTMMWFAGVLEIIDDFDGDTFRAVNTVRFAMVVYVLHAFQKKSKHGIATPRTE